MQHYDLIVIGSGAAGLTAAFTALGFKKKVLIIEKHKPGGECTWSGCVPSKGLINQAKEIHIAKKYGPVEVDSQALLQKVRQISEDIYQHETPEVLKNAGADFVTGAAEFESAKVIRVGDQRFGAKRVIIATGSRPLVPKIEGLDQVPYLTNEQFFEQQQLPDSMLVLGGGAIGMELAQALNRLGVRVQLVEMAPEVMFKEEPEFAGRLRAKLESEGVQFHLGAQATAVTQTEQGTIKLVAKQGDQTLTLEADRLLLALGRQANIEGLNLAAAGIATDRGITVDANLQTTAKGVYACGDVAGPYQFSHMANYQGKIATMNAMLPFKRKAHYQHIAWTTFTDPEFARAGMTEAEARTQYGDSIRVFHYDMAEKLDRAKTKAGDGGHIKLITRKGKVLGAHILAERAGEMICQVQVLKSLGLKFSKLQGVIHPYPTYSDALRQLAQQVFLDGLLNHPIVKLFRRS